MNSPKVSILIPVYNRKKYIAECIQSALDQTFTDIEIVVVDNASSDGTWEISQEYAARDGRVRIFRNATNIGPVLNWQRCIDEAKGVFGKLLFSDDLIYQDYLEKTLPFFADDEVGFVFCSVHMGSEPSKGQIAYKSVGVSGVYPSTDFIAASLFGGDVPISPGCAIFRISDLKKNLILDIPSPTIDDFLSHGAGPDLLLYLLAAKTYTSFAYIKEPLCFFREHEGSLSVSDKNQHLSRCYIQAKVWFAETYYERSIIKNYYIHTWYEYCRYSKNWEMPSAFLRNFTNHSDDFFIVQICKLLTSRLLLKFKQFFGFILGKRVTL